MSTSMLNTPYAIPVATSPEIHGYRTARYIGPAFGVIARSMGFARGLTGSIRSLKKGEVPEFTVTVEEARHMAVVRLVEHAQAMGANAVISMRFDSTEMGEGGLAEIVAYGTAVVVEV
ncbi:MAG TPA: heavy metal-binding domain-containing protein [Thermoleophilia bacterium]|nr:heavy metal-binding domain-containing protein [Thermoleophilia bacterium]